MSQRPHDFPPELPRFGRARGLGQLGDNRGVGGGNKRQYSLLIGLFARKQARRDVPAGNVRRGRPPSDSRDIGSVGARRSASYSRNCLRKGRNRRGQFLLLISIRSKSRRTQDRKGGSQVCRISGDLRYRCQEGLRFGSGQFASGESQLRVNFQLICADQQFVEKPETPVLLVFEAIDNHLHWVSMFRQSVQCSAPSAQNPARWGQSLNPKAAARFWHRRAQDVT